MIKFKFRLIVNLGCCNWFKWCNSWLIVNWVIVVIGCWIVVNGIWVIVVNGWLLYFIMVILFGMWKCCCCNLLIILMVILLEFVNIVVGWLLGFKDVNCFFNVCLFVIVCCCVKI